MIDVIPYAVITGGSSDLAQAMAKDWRGSGWKVDTPLRDELDVTKAESIEQFFAQRTPDLLVCNAGITRDALFARLSESDWDDTWSVNYEGALRCAMAVLPAMCERKSGHIVFISSFSALHPPLGQTAYASAKAALLGLVSDLAVRHGSSGIRINAVLPGFLETRMTRHVSESRKDEVISHHTLGRLNTCEQVAKFIGFLHSSLPHTSGQVFQLDSRLASW